MVVSTLLARGASSLQRCVFAAALLVVFVGLVHYLDAIPSKNIFASPRAHAINRLRLGGAAQQYHMEPLCGPGALKHLRTLGLTPDITYSRRCIKPVFPVDVDRDMVTNVSSPLITNTTTISLQHPDGCSNDVERLPCDPIELPVPRPQAKNKGQYSHLIFGVATTYERLRESLPPFAHWLEDSGAALVGLLVDDPAELHRLNFSALEAEYAARGMDLKLVPKHDPADTTEQSHMMVIDDMLAYAEEKGQQQQQRHMQQEPHWLGVLDDDTFFPSLPALAAVLAQYDHARPQYLGQLTENAALLTSERILGGFGGAGVFLSTPLARELRPHLAACRGGIGGDMQIMDCVHRHSAARLTRVPGLWQCDFFGDPTGFYESGRRMLSMHHWKSWNQLPAREMAAVTEVCGDCFLQRFVFERASEDDQEMKKEEDVEEDVEEEEEETVVLNNGYSINVYAPGVALPDLSRTEQTWDNPDRDPWKDYEWSLGLLRERVGRDKKKTYQLVTVVPGEDGQLTQVYLHRGEVEGENDEVIELLWQPS